ncbi:MAG: hypothetical protein OEW34_05670 [Burkholderiaceae bacterium]|nr:hypothetical protein [Burkholderiaceae bacterium]
MDQKYPIYGMRATPSRFSSFVLAIDPNLEARPVTLDQPRKLPSQLSVLEQRYPQVVRTLTLLWGYPELNQYFDNIASGLDTRLNGLEPAAMSELMLLSAVHQGVCPHRPARKVQDEHGASRLGGPWRSTGDRYR